MAALARPELREFMGELIVVRLVENTNCYRKRVFYVIDDRKPVLFTTHWRYKNVSGVSFKQQETVAAIEWVYHVLLAGFTHSAHHENSREDWAPGARLNMVSTGKTSNGLNKHCTART